MEKKIRDQIRSLKYYNGILTIAVVSIIFFSFRDSGKKKFDEISVERLNVIAKDGSLRLVIADKGRLPYATVNGKVVNSQERGPGMIMFNSLGDECGGYMWDAYKDGSAGHILTMDQYKQDQVVTLTYQESKGKFGDPAKTRFAGLSINPQPTTITLDEFITQREEIKKIPDSSLRATALDKLYSSYGSNSLFVGKKRNDDLGLFVNDENLNPRLKLYVDKYGNPKLQFLDSTGNVIYSLPDK